MFSSKEIYLHIGLHKTATTFLQHYFFPKLEGVNYYNRQIDLNRLFAKSGKIVVSNEGMSGCPYLINEIDYYEQFKISVDHLLSVFNSPKIIVCFREPSSFIESIYKQYLHEGGTLNWEEFFSLNGKSKLKPDDFKFSKFVNYLADIVPPHNLFIYDFSTFKKYTAIVINSMSLFITGHNFTAEIDSRKSNSAVPLALEKFLIRANKYLGHKVKLKIFGKVFNQRTIFQTLIPRLFTFNTQRDLSEIKKYYEEDYRITKKLISELNNKTYSKI